jgi:hypothetical protein
VSRKDRSASHFVFRSLSELRVKREIISLIGLSLFLVIARLGLSQNGNPPACPDVTPGTLACELVAWSHVQEPVPLPEPDAKPMPPPDQYGGSSPNSQPETPTSTRNITGIIVKQGEKYMLKADDNTTYQLDNQNRARQYQDKQVRVVGRVDAKSNSLHIESIELAW